MTSDESTEAVSMLVESFGITDIGLVRQNNEDVWAELPSINFYVLADGMGGHQAGEVAAKEAVLSLTRSIPNYFPNGSFTNEELILKMKEAILEANFWVYHLSKEHEEFAGMGTTLCCFLLHRETLVYAHAGDSRIYRFRGTLKQLTQDHSLRRELISKMKLDEKNTTPGLFKNVITRAIGTTSHVEPEVATTKAQPGDIYFLCSDGLTDTVPDSQISEILQNAPSIKQACETLVSTAKANGGNDNITIVMIKITQ